MIALMLLASIPVAFVSYTDARLHTSTRRLLFDKIAGYTPETLVTSQNAIDLDQREFATQLALGTSNGFETAMRIYNEGAFSDSIALLNLTAPLPDILSTGDEVIGSSENGARAVFGRIIDNYAKGTKRIRVKYDANGIQSLYVQCQVAANPNPNLEGCFANSGRLIITGFEESISYTYNQLEDNVSERSIADFSKDARTEMELCKNCPYKDHLKFRKYYGTADYADQWIRYAHEGRQTDFSNGNADFTLYGEAGKFEVMSKASAFMSIWMYAIRDMEDALDKCGSQEQISSAVHAWDQAVAFYAGSLEGQDGLGEGVLIYDLADKRCQDFKTCGIDSNSQVGTSFVNLKVFDEFKDGLGNLKQYQCSGARAKKERIVQLMTVPLIQGTLRSAFDQGTGEAATEQGEAEGAIFAATILPIIHACDGEGTKNAAIIFENMKTGHRPTDFLKVKAALERSYKCLGILCSDVGGVWDESANKYRANAAPCIGDGTSSSSKYSSDNAGLVVGLAIGGVSCIFLIVAVSSFFGKKPAPVPTIVPPAELL